MLKYWYTNVGIELISDPTLHQCIEKSIGGGISMITKRFSRANNKYLPETYDPSKPSKYIMYLDKNNLYGYAMSHHFQLEDCVLLLKRKFQKEMLIIFQKDF